MMKMMMKMRPLPRNQLVVMMTTMKKKRTRSRRHSHLLPQFWLEDLSQAQETLLSNSTLRLSCSHRPRFWLCLASTTSKYWLSTSTSKQETSASTWRSTTSKAQPFCTKLTKITFWLEPLAACSKFGTLTPLLLNLHLNRYSTHILAPNRVYLRSFASLTHHLWLLEKREVKTASS